MNKREMILLAAMNLFVEKGVQGTPMSAIAKAAGSGMGTIYNYFATKEALINAIYLHIKTSEIIQTLKSLDSNCSLKTKFLEFYISVIKFYLKQPSGFAFMDQMQNSPLITEATKAQGKNAFLPVFELIEQGQKEGIIKPLAMESIIYFLAGTINTFVRWIQKADKATQEQMIADQLSMVWDAVKA